MRAERALWATLRRGVGWAVVLVAGAILVVGCATAPGAEEGEGARSPPVLANREYYQRMLVREYPPALRNAGIGGTASVWVYLDEDGHVTEERLGTSSGHKALDDAALRVARLMRFKPAIHDGMPVSVWVGYPVTFEVRRQRR